MLKWSRSKSRRSLLPRTADKQTPFRQRFRKNRTDVELVDSSAVREEITILSAIDFDPDGDLDEYDPLSGKKGYVLVVNDDETGFTLVAP